MKLGASGSSVRAVPGPDDALRELTRGIAELHSIEDLRSRLASGKRLRVKAGFDPTRPDLHLGHTVLMQKMRQFQDLGHEVVFLIGDFTALVGDPTGQNESRPRLTRDQVLAAAATYAEQAFKVLDRERTVVRYNSEWLNELSLEKIIELAARRTLARTLERRDFKERYESHRDIHLHELLYPLLQAYDSVALKCDVELGGSDQLFNLMVGRDLMRAYGLEPQIVMTTPILEGLDARVDGERIVGKKMSKSADNYVGVSEPPLEMQRKLMQIDDAVIWRYYELLSARSSGEIAALRASGDALVAKSAFAGEIIARYHGEAAAERARAEFARTYLAAEVPEDVPEVEVQTEGASLLLAYALNKAGLVASTSAGRREIEGGGVELDGVRVRDPAIVLERGRTYLARVGSKRRRFARIRVPE